MKEIDNYVTYFTLTLGLFFKHIILFMLMDNWFLLYWHTIGTFYPDNYMAHITLTLFVPDTHLVPYKPGCYMAPLSW